MSPRAAAAGDGRPPKDWHVMNHGRDNKGGKPNPDEAGPIAAAVFRNPPSFWVLGLKGGGGGW